MVTKQSEKLILQKSPEEFSRTDFEFIRKLGDGAFGQVWKVRHKKTSKLFAIKQVQKSKVLRILEQFKREIEILYSLSHPHIVKLYAHFEDLKFFYMVLELLDYGNLFSKLAKEHLLTERVAAQYFREIVLSVEYLHSRDPVVIHRDIKPENIMIDKTGKVKLADFGWANYLNNDSERMTSCGTLEYLPPEMVNERGHDTSVDIWCLGILLFEMLTGSTPFKANGKEKTMKNITSSQIKFPFGFSHIAKDLIQKMLERDKSKRIDIFHVKSHKWLAIIQPIRETLIQNLSPRFLVPEELNKTDEVKTTYSENDTDEDFKLNSISAFHQSINKLKVQLLHKSQAAKSNRASLMENTEELARLSQKQKKLQDEIREKQNELVFYEGTNKVLLCRCFELNLDLERLQIIDSQPLSDKVKDLQKGYVEVKKKVKLTQIHLENLKNQVASSTSTYQGFEKTLKSLQKQFSDLKSSSSNRRSKHNISISELELNLDLISSKIKEKDQKNPKFSQSESKISEDLIDFIKENMEESKRKNREMNRKLETLEDLANEKEQQITELSIDYEMRKSKKLHFLRKKKDENSRNQRKAKEELRQALVKANENLRNSLKSKISLSRSQEVYIEPHQIEAAKNRIENLKRLISKLEVMSRKKSLSHLKNLEEIQLKKIRLAEMRMTIDSLKSRSRANSLMDI